MEWISVDADLPKNYEQVLGLVEGYFCSEFSPLGQKKSHRIFQCTFERSTGWHIPFAPSGCNVNFWMRKPDEPLSQ